MKFLISLYILVIALTGFATAASFTDGGFETMSDFIPWSSVEGEWGTFITGASDAVFEITTEQKHSGARSAKYSRTDPGSDNIHLDQILGVTPNTIYEITAWVKGDGILEPIISAQTMGWAILASASVAPSNQWTKVSLIFDSGSNTQIRFLWFAGANGTMYTGVPGTSYLDDVWIEDISNLFDQAMKDKYNFDRAEIGPVTPGSIGDPHPLRPMKVQNGVLVYDDASQDEVALFGASLGTGYFGYITILGKYGLPLNSTTLHNEVDDNMDRIVRMGADLIRIHIQASDLADENGDLVSTVFLDALDYQIYQTAQRGLYIHLTTLLELNTFYISDSFLINRPKEEWIVDPDIISKSQTFITNLLNRTNPYTGVKYKDDPAIAIIELIGEPYTIDYDTMITDPTYAALKADFEARPSPSAFPKFDYIDYRYDYTKAYINNMCATIRNTGCVKPIAWSLNWFGYLYSKGYFTDDPGWINSLIEGNEAIFQAAADSNVDIVTFSLYPGLYDIDPEYWYYPENLDGNNYLPFIKDTYDYYGGLRWALGTRFESKAIVTYEFENLFQQTTHMYPAMARIMRALGSQMASMWRYRPSPSAEYDAGSHILNLDCTPPKAASFAIASEVFKTTGRNAPYVAPTDDNLVFDNTLGVSFQNNLSVLRTADTYMYSTGDDWLPSPLSVPTAPTKIVGREDSTLVQYAGTGIYFMDIGADIINLEITPDASWLSEHWNSVWSPPYYKTVLLDHDTLHTFTLDHPDWQGNAIVERYESGNWDIVHTGTLSFPAKAGKYRIAQILCEGANLDSIGVVDFADFAVLAAQWQDVPGIPSADIAPQPITDDFVDIQDLAVIIEYWLDGNCVSPLNH